MFLMKIILVQVMCSYHPDFQHGRPAYFDVSVRSTTQPSHISFSSSCAGVAAAAGELAKDQRHQDAVDRVCKPKKIDIFKSTYKL